MLSLNKTGNFPQSYQNISEEQLITVEHQMNVEPRQVKPMTINGLLTNHLKHGYDDQLDDDQLDHNRALAEGSIVASHDWNKN